jgi:hypothetical protein
MAYVSLSLTKWREDRGQRGRREPALSRHDIRQAVRPSSIPDGLSFFQARMRWRAGLLAPASRAFKTAAGNC